MITSQGWLVAGLGLAMVAVGRLFGIYELFLLGAGLVGAVLVCTWAVARTKLQLLVTRELQPSRLYAGQPGRVDLRVINTGDLRTPVIELHDRVGADHVATVLLGRMDTDVALEAEYRLDTDQRGVLEVGPLVVEVADPFGIARARREAAGVAELTIWPAVVPLDPLPNTAGDDPHDGIDRSHVAAVKGEEFHALRPYVVGDDLRRVHWRTSARLEQPVVRQDRPPWMARSTVLIDTRRSSHSPASFERAVSAAASVLVACSDRGHRVRLVTSGGSDSGWSEGGVHMERLLDRLAVVRLDDRGLLEGVAALERPGSGGALAVVLGAREGPGRLHHYQRTVVVRVTDDDETPFSEVWSRALVLARLHGTVAG